MNPSKKSQGLLFVGDHKNQFTPQQLQLIESYLNPQPVSLTGQAVGLGR